MQQQHVDIGQAALGQTKIVVDTLSLGTVVATILGYLPPIAALVSICWYAVLFYDRFQKRKNQK